MGEAVSSSEGGIEWLKVRETVAEAAAILQPEKIIRTEKSISGGGAAVSGNSSSVVKWESFLPKMAVRVLLAESDDSTRQIITALLRKCSYRVAAVSDGLKAWELLKGRPHNIDLILTEVELPSISGYALLTLTMEHHICKNIPVIMMSSNDSVSTVYNCMLRGAADFLVKPVRKNELRNLWQHVWRKQVAGRHIAAGPGIPEESIAQTEVEATAENNANSINHSSKYLACSQRNKECVDKGNDAQSSCTKPELENERVEMEDAVHCLPLFKNSDFRLDGAIIPLHDQHHLESRLTQPPNYKTGESLELTNGDHGASTQEQNKICDNYLEQNNRIEQTYETNHILESSAKEAIDLIGAFDNFLKNNLGMYVSNVAANKFESFPVLDLSLRRSPPSGSVDQVNGEKHTLNHSDASAFYKYKNKPLQPSNTTSPSTCNQPKDQETNSEKQQSNHTPDYNSDTHGPTITSQKTVSVANIQTGHHEITFGYPQQKGASLPIPANGVRFDNVINSYGSVIPARYCKETSLSSLHSPGSAQCSEPVPQLNSLHPSERQPLNSQKFHDVMDQRISNAIDQIDDKSVQNTGKLENRKHFSHVNDQSVDNNCCDGNISQHYGTSSGTNGKVNTFTIVNARSECGNEEAFHVYEEASHRSQQREAALTKFRLKRKDRCFEKKVRYESRKKLAEQRPRVKGQFVRRAPSDAQPESS